MAETARRRPRGHREPGPKPPSSMARYPQAAGNSLPAAPNARGSSSAGNMMPDSMMEGRKTSWENMVSFAWLLTASPRTLATPSEAAMIAADVSTKAAAVEIGFVDRFNGSLVITGDVAAVEAALRNVMQVLCNMMGFSPAPLTKT